MTDVESARSSTGDELADESMWDAYWAKLRLPVEVAHGSGRSVDDAILDVFDAHLTPGAGKTAVEIGGAPGQYLAYVAKSLGYAITCIDYSAVGCRKTEENYRLLGINGRVVRRDIFEKAEGERFDLVYSLGLIEHFSDLIEVVERHVQLVKSGGLLVLGVPNLRGVNGWFFRRLDPSVYATHNLTTMDLSTWASFERPLGLETLFKGYISGFQPRTFRRREAHGMKAWALFLASALLTAFVDRLPGALWRRDGPRVSGYGIGVYRFVGAATIPRVKA